MRNYFQQQVEKNPIQQNASTHTSASFIRYSVAWISLMAYLEQPIDVIAEVVADQSAAANNRPIIDSTANGLPLVQIATPSPAGVSHNQYTHFNVDPAGIILNNSQATVLTQQAGYVPPNPNLAKTTSRVILNEITSTNSSLLSGYTEVAGVKAEVIIANPNGISCNGCGFINTSRGVLTTGIPVMGYGGSLEAFRVTGGNIQIGTAGMNGSNIDQLDLITRSVKVNGELWATNLNVITGENLVDYNTLGVQLIQGNPNKPIVGIDVALLGGMYAGKIRMIGTEAGVGVNSLGALSAQAGDFTLDNRGQITLLGSVTSSGNLSINSNTGISNSGTLYSRQAAQIISSGDITNSGLLSAQGNLTLNAANLDSTGTLGAGIDTGSAATQNGNISIATQNQTIATGQNVAGGSLSIVASNINLADSNNNAWDGINLDTTAGNASAGSGGIIDLTGAWTQSAGNIVLNATGVVNNTSGRLFGAQIASNSANFNNSNGSLGASGNISLATTGNLTNTGGQIGSGQDLLIDANTIIGNGLAIAGRDAAINLQGNYTNTTGNVLKANRNLSFSSTGNLINQTAMEAVEKLTLSAANISNQTDASINSDRTMLNSVGDITNAGRIEGNIVETHSNNFTNTATVMGDVLDLYANNLNNLNAAAFIGATHSVNLTIANALNNQDGASIYSLADINIGSNLALNTNGYLIGNTASFTNQSATIEAAGNMRISANTITNMRSVMGVEWGPSWTGTYVSGNPRYTPTFSDQRFTATTTPAAQMLAGANMWISGDVLTNSYSNIIAGGALTAQLTNLINTGDPFRRRESRLGQQDIQVWQQVGTWCPSGISIFGGCAGGTAAVMGWVTVTTVYAPAPIYSNIPGSVNVSYFYNTQPAIAPRTVNTQSIAAEGVPTVTNSAALPPLTVPTGGLYGTHPGQQYLVVTDPRFTSYQNFVSSDYMLNRLVLDPQQIQKRLGDGFYEQKLVSEHISAQTGRRYLDGYADAQTQFIALLDAGVTTATDLQLVPGIALTAKQINALTRDIVWMEERDVALPDGSIERILAPQVYLTRLHQDDLKPSGALLAANDIHINASDSIINSGLIQGRGNNILQTNNITNNGGVIGSTGLTKLNASNDILNRSGNINGQNVDLVAGRDIINQRTGLDVTRTVSLGEQPNTGLGIGLFRRAPTPLTGVVNSTELGLESVFSATNNLSLNAGRDLTLTAANISSGGDTTFTAGRNLNSGVLTASETSTTSRYNASSSTVTQLGSSIQTRGNLDLSAGNNILLASAALDVGKDARLVAGGNLSLEAAKNGNSLSFDTGAVQQKSHDETVIGTTLNAGGNITLSAANDTGEANARGGNVILHSATLSSQSGQLNILADSNINIDNSVERHQFFQQTRVEDSGFFSSTTTTTRDQRNETQAIGSHLDGDSITLQSGKDVHITGSDIVAGHEVVLKANNNININAAQNTFQASHFRDEQTSGLFSDGGLSVTLGSKQQTDTLTEQRTTHTASTLGSINGNISIVAGKYFSQTGSDILSPQGSIDITAQNARINAALNSGNSVATSEFKQSGITASLGSPVLNAAQTTRQMHTAARQTSSERMKTLAAANAALSINSAINTVSSGLGNDSANLTDNLGGIDLNVNMGNSRSESTSTQTWSQAQGSQLKAGNNINISATGAGNQSDLTIRGSDVTAGHDTRLMADNNINLLAAKNTVTQISSNNNSSNSIGAGISTNNGFTVNLAASRGLGNSDGNDVTYTNTHVYAGNILSIGSGSDTTLTGAVASGKQVIAKVGGNLNIESQQDTSTYQSEQKNAGFALAIPIAGSGGASINYGKSNIDSIYASVTEQSGIKAGDGGFDVQVGGNTNLNGAVIASTDYAITDHSNTFTSATLTTGDIENNASYSANSYGVSLGTGIGLDDKLAPGGTSAGLGKDDGNLASVTQSGISGIAGNTAARTGDAETGVQKIFDAEKVQKEINAQVQITQAFGQQASKVVADYVQEQRLALQKQLGSAKTESEKISVQIQLDELRLQEQVMNVLIGAVSGLGGAALTKETLSAAADQMRQIMIEDSKKFAGVTDGTTTLSNISGESEGVRGDGMKIGGTRVDLDLLCGTGNERCMIQQNADGKPALDSNGNTQLALNEQNQVQFTQGSLNEFLKTDQGKKLSGATGGVQGAKGTLFDIPYAADSWQDKLIEAFSGTHDMLGGKFSGLYDEQGNATRGRNDTMQYIQNAWSATGAITASTPFAMAEFLPPQVWQAISLLLKNAK